MMHPRVRSDKSHQDFIIALLIDKVKIYRIQITTQDSISDYRYTNHTRVREQNLLTSKTHPVENRPIFRYPLKESTFSPLTFTVPALQYLYQKRILMLTPTIHCKLGNHGSIPRTKTIEDFQKPRCYQRGIAFCSNGESCPPY